MTGAHWVGNCSTHSLTNFGFFLSLATAAISIHPGGEKTYTYLQKNDYNYESFCYLVDHQNVHKKFLWLYTRPKWIHIHLNAYCIRTTARYFFVEYWREICFSWKILFTYTEFVVPMYKNNCIMLCIFTLKHLYQLLLWMKNKYAYVFYFCCVSFHYLRDLH